MPIPPIYRQRAEDAQNRAAQATEPHVRLVAGPGTGKSHTIVQRVSWLLNRGVSPAEIAVISFTNASVRDLREKILARCVQDEVVDSDKLSISTLHSLALYVLKRTGNLNDYPVEPLVLSEPEVEDYIYDVEFKHIAGIQTSGRCGEIRRFFDAVWSTGRKDAPTYVPPTQPVTDEEMQKFEHFHNPTSKVYSCVLPGEIIRKCVDLVKLNLLDPQEVLQLKHLIVDEYQDFNAADQEFVESLAQRGVHVFVAGDDDQSVYGFRHASPEGIQKYTAKYADTGDYYLLDCFRCTCHVVETAQNLIMRNSPADRIPKQLKSLYSQCSPAMDGFVHTWRFGAAKTEAIAVASSCEALIRADLPAKDIFILLANAQRQHQLWPLIETELKARQLPYSPPKAERFEDDKSGHYVQALFRIICHRGDDGTPLDAVAHRLLLGLRNGIGVTVCEYLRRFVLNRPNYTYFDLFYQLLPSDLDDKKAKRAVEAVCDVCSELAEWQEKDDIAQRAQRVAELLTSALGEKAVTGWQAYAGTLPDGINISELLEYMTANTDDDRKRAMERYSKRTGTKLPEDTLIPSKIRVMTMHGAKGLTGKVVFIPGLEEGVMPNTRAQPSQSSVMEYARLLYVSITRAQSVCVMSYACKRLMQGDFDSRRPSPFFQHMGRPIVDRNNGFSNAEVAEIMDAIRDL